MAAHLLDMSEFIANHIVWSLMVHILVLTAAAVGAVRMSRKRSPRVLVVAFLMIGFASVVLLPTVYGNGRTSIIKNALHDRYGVAPSDLPEDWHENGATWVIDGETHVCDIDLSDFRDPRLECALSTFDKVEPPVRHGR